MKARLYKAILMGLIIGFVGLVLSLVPPGPKLEKNTGLDILFQLRGRKAPPPDALVVSIDKESAEKLNVPENPDKWPRSLHARLVENLAREGARVITFDVHFIEPRRPEDDRMLAGAIDRARNVILCEPCRAREIPASRTEDTGTNAGSIIQVVKPIAPLAEAASATAPFILPRIPFKVSHYWTFQSGVGDCPTMPVMVFYLYVQSVYDQFFRLMEQAAPGVTAALTRAGEGSFPSSGLKLRVMLIRERFLQDPLLAEKMTAGLAKIRFSGLTEAERQRIVALIHMFQGGNVRFLNYYGPPRTIATLPFHQALRVHEGMVDGRKVELQGKAVFVGLSEVLLAERKDSFYTVFSEDDGLFVSGVEIMATAFSNLLEDQPVQPVGLPAFIAVLAGWGLLAGFLGRFFSMTRAFLSVLGVSLLYLLLSVYRFQVHNDWLPMAVPLFLQGPLGFLGGQGWNYVETRKERENIKKALAFYVPKDVVSQLSKNISHIQAGGQVVFGICLFTDAKNYTTLSETMEPADLGKFMNRYYETIFKPVKEHEGFVSGVIGDAMLALWVTPTCDNLLPIKACQAGLGIQESLQQFSQESGGASLKTRIGLHCGQMLLGHVGALDHYEYTPMGDIVNTASRIESLNKHLGTTLLVSGELIRELQGFVTRDLGTFKLKGKLKPIAVHELVGRVGELDEKRGAAFRLFSDAMHRFWEQDWESAREKFTWVDRELGGDGPARFFMNRCRNYQERPPDPGWDRVVHMEKK
jgi:adenylate cyclase